MGAVAAVQSIEPRSFSQGVARKLSILLGKASGGALPQQQDAGDQEQRPGISPIIGPQRRVAAAEKDQPADQGGEDGRQRRQQKRARPADQRQKPGEDGNGIGQMRSLTRRTEAGPARCAGLPRARAQGNLLFRADGIGG